MKLHRFIFVFVFAFSSFVVAGEPGQEDAPVEILHADKIWPHQTIGQPLSDNEKAEQLRYAEECLKYAQEELKCEKMASFFKDVVARKTAQLSYVEEPFDGLHKQRAEFSSFMSQKESASLVNQKSRHSKKRKPFIINKPSS